MPPYRLVRNAVAAGLLLAQGSAAAFTGSDTVAIYWGQNSYGATGKLAQQSLATYCANTDIDVIPMSFLIQMTSGVGGTPVINFANTGDSCGTFAGTQLLDCPQIGKDIKTCQEQYGKTILLSIGGATYTEGGFKSEAQAIDMANLIWDMFGPANSNAASIAIDGNPTVAPITGIPITDWGVGNVTATGNSSAISFNPLTMLDAAGSSLIQTMPADFPPFTVSRSEEGVSLTEALASGSSIPLVEAEADLTELPGLVPGSPSSVVPSNPAPSPSSSSRAPSVPSVPSTTGPLTELSGMPPGSSSSRSSTTTTRRTTTTTRRSTTTTRRTTTTTRSTTRSTTTSRSSTPLTELSGFIPSSTTRSTTRAPSSPTTRPPTSTTLPPLGPNFTRVVYTFRTTFSDRIETEYVTRTENVNNFRDAVADATPITTATGTWPSDPFGPIVTIWVDDNGIERDMSQQASASTVLRPFHDASVDGFDLDIEAPTQNFVPFAKRLRTLMDAANSDATLGRQFYLTSAPQCPYPDVNNDAMLNGGVGFDAIFVQFYNNYCGIQSYNPAATTQWNYNFDTWNRWAVNASANPNVKIFVGVPSGPTAAGSGYLSVSALKPVIEYSKKFSSFGGIMAWDASQAYANDGWLAGVKSLIASAAAPIVSSTTTTRSSSSTTTSRPASSSTTTTRAPTSTTRAITTTTSQPQQTSTRIPTTVLSPSSTTTTRQSSTTTTLRPTTTSTRSSTSTTTLRPSTTTTARSSTSTTTRQTTTTSRSTSQIADPVTRSTSSSASTSSKPPCCTASPIQPVNGSSSPSTTSTSSAKPSSSSAAPISPPEYGAPPSYKIVDVQAEASGEEEEY